MVWSLLLVGNLTQQPGRTTWDTKYDLTANPGGFLERSLHLWNPDASFGELQNQAYGYLFPQGPFFLLGDLLSVPDWIWQRMWSALLLIAAYEGVRAVGRLLGFSHFAAVLAGLVYAWSPRLLGAVGILSGEVLPTAVLPWVVLPLLLAREGRLSPRQGGLWSGVALLFMSGVNAAGTLATFPLLIALVVEQFRRAHGRALAAWWAAGVAAATAWWVVPLVLLGRYSPPFLDYIETSASTTYSTSWANGVRGSEHWLAYYTIGDQAWWPGAHQLATNPWLILAGTGIAAIGLAGLVHRTMPVRLPLLAAALVGLLCLTAANPALLGSFLDAPMRDLLDGPLAPFRNVHKVDPLIRLPLALGFAHAVVLLRARIADADLRRLTTLGVVALVAASSIPLFTNNLRMPGFEKVPDAWAQTADYLADRPDSRALVLPGSGFGIQSWGWTIDEPLQGEARTSWVTRSQVPLVPGPTARYLDTIERRITSGEGSEQLAALLARAGISHVVLRRDLDPFHTETVPADRAEAALLHSSGLSKVASFGESGFGDIALIDVYEVAGEHPVIDLLDEEALPRLVGSPDDLLPALETGVLGPEPALIGPDTGDSPGVVGDSYARVERQFGRVHDAISDVMDLDDPTRDGRPSADFPGVDGVGQVSAELLAGGRIEASSSQGYSDEFGPVRPEFAPGAAFDGSLGTEWRSGTLQRAEDQWLQLNLDHPVLGGSMAVQFVDVDSGARVVRARVVITSTEGAVYSAVYGVPAGGRLTVPIPQDAVDRFRIEVVETRGENPAYGHVAVAEIELPGVRTGRTLIVPTTIGADDALVLRTDPPRRACVDIGLGPNCTADAVRRPADSGRLDRTFEVTDAGAWNLAGSVVAIPGRAAANLLAPVENVATARARSVFHGDPAVSGLFAFDGDPGTAWLSSEDAARARLVLRWRGERTLDRLSLAGAGTTAAVTPRVAILQAGEERRVVDLTYSQEFEPLVARGRVVITFPRPDGAGAQGRPIGVGEIDLDGLVDLKYAPSWDGPTGAACGLGPQVRIDGAVHDTQVTGTLDDVRLGTPLQWRVCDGPVRLEAGTHRLTVAPTFQFQAVNLALAPIGQLDAAGAAGSTRSERSLEIEEWEPTSRTVQVGAGEAAVLRIAESTNAGWRATLDGDPLEPITVDGWQQGYRIPAGEGGTVRVEFGPDRTYRAGLLVGLALVLLLVAGAVVGQVRDRRRTAPLPAPTPPAPARPARLAPAVGRWTAGAGLLLLGGPFSGAGFALASWKRVRRAVMPVGVALIVASGLWSAWAENTAFGRPPDLAIWSAAAGVGLLVGSVAFPFAPADEVTAVQPWSVVFTRSLRTTWAWLRANPVVVAGVCLILVQAVVRWWVADGSYWWQDDFVHLDLAHRTGLSSDLVFRQHNEHVEFLPFAFFWVLSLPGGTSFLPAVVALVALQTIAAGLFWTLLCTLFGRSRWLLVPLAAYLFTPLSLVGATWFASGVEAFTLQIAMFGAVLGLVHLRGSARRAKVGWALVSLAFFAFGVLCWQKAAVVFPILVAVDVLVLSAGAPLRERLRALRVRWWYWAALLVVLASYIAVYASLTTTDDFGGATAKSVAGSLQDMLLKVFLPGMLGGPWTTHGALNSIFPDPPLVVQVVALVVVVGIVVLSLVRRGRAALAGWLIVAGYLAGNAGLLLAGRNEFLGLVSRDPRYFTDAVPVVLIGVCAAFAVPAGRTEPAEERPPVPRRLVRAVPLALTLALVGSGLTTTGLLATRLQHEESRAWVENLAYGVSVDPGASISSAFAPDDIALTRSAELILGAVGLQQRLDQPGTDPQVVTGQGEVVPAYLNFVDLVETGPRPGCGWAIHGLPTPIVNLPPLDDQRAVELDLVSGRPGVLHIIVDGVEQAVSYEAGAHSLYFATTRLDGPLLAWVSNNADGACISRVRRGALWPYERED